jgi:glucose-6-phosphate 1-dehydrogenase
MRGDSTLFAREDLVEQAWRIVEPVLGSATPVIKYEPNSWGPVQAQSLTLATGPWNDPKDTPSTRTTG